MADDLIYCPACNGKLQLPAELYGQTVECPHCRGRFVAPVPLAVAVSEPPAVVPVGYTPAYAGVPRPVADRVRSALTAPAVLLLALATLGALTATVEAVKADQRVHDLRSAHPPLGVERALEVAHVLRLQPEVHFLPHLVAEG